MSEHDQTPGDRPPIGGLGKHRRRKFLGIVAGIAGGAAASAKALGRSFLAPVPQGPAPVACRETVAGTGTVTTTITLPSTTYSTTVTLPGTGTLSGTLTGTTTVLATGTITVTSPVVTRDGGTLTLTTMTVTQTYRHSATATVTNTISQSDSTVTLSGSAPSSTMTATVTVSWVYMRPCLVVIASPGGGEVEIVRALLPNDLTVPRTIQIAKGPSTLPGNEPIVFLGA